VGGKGGEGGREKRGEGIVRGEASIGEMGEERKKGRKKERRKV